jgi:hypothetical protein
MALAAVPIARAQAVQPATKQSSHAELLAQYGRLKMSFEPNVGQTDSAVKFLSRGPGYSLFLTGRGAVLRLRKGFSGSRPQAITMELAGSDAATQAMGEDALPGKSNYFIGRDPSRWHTGVPNFRRVHYQGIYPGIDLSYYGNGQQLEYDFVLAPGAKPETIRMCVEGVQTLRLDKSGDLILAVGGGEVRFKKPYLYQMIGGMRQTVSGRYALRGREVAFRLGPYDQTQPLVIDPVLMYSTYLGGSNLDAANAIAVGSDGTAFVAGETDSTDFPTAHPLQPEDGGPLDFPDDAFVTKLSADGSTLLYSTYLGGTKQDSASGIAVDSFGAAYVTGTTISEDFPHSLGAFDPNCGVDGHCNSTLFNGLLTSDAFITKLNPEGSALVYSGFLGGLGNTRGLAIAVDNNGSAYVTGTTDASAQFPASGGTLSGFQTVFGGAVTDAYIAKLSSTGSSLPYVTYLGGNAEDDGFGIAVDGSGHAFVTGLTFSTDLPTTAGGFQLAPGGNGDAFVTEVDTTVTGAGSLLYSTYLGGGARDQGNAIALDSTGKVYVAGVTNSAGASPFPTTGAVIQPACALDASTECEGDAFVSKLDTTQAGAASLLDSTYFGGTGADSAAGIAVDSSANVYITGFTNSSADFPVTTGIFQPNFGGGNGDAFVAKLATDLGTVDYSSYLGGSNTEDGRGIAVDNGVPPNAYVTGQTCSIDFPTVAPEQATPAGNCDAFISKVAIAAGASVGISPSAVAFPVQGVGIASAPPVSVSVISNGGAPLTISNIAITGDFAESDNCFGVTLAVGVTCTVQITFTPTATGKRNGTLTITDNAVNSPQVVNLSGTGTAPADFSLSALPLAATVIAGGSTTFTFTVTPLTGFNNAVNMSCTSPSATISCSPSSPSVQISGTSPASVAVNVSTIARVISPPGSWRKFIPPTLPPQVLPWLLAMLGLAMLTALAARRRRVLLSLGLAGALLAASCGGSAVGVPRGTPAGNYTITITGTSGSLNHTATVTLTVQ